MKRITIFNNVKNREMDMTIGEYKKGNFEGCDVIREYETSSKKKSKKKQYSNNKVDEYDNN